MAASSAGPLPLPAPLPRPQQLQLTADGPTTSSPSLSSARFTPSLQDTSERASSRSSGERGGRRRTRYTANTHFREDVLSIPGYQFQTATRWQDVGSATLLAQGVNLKDGSNVFAKMAQAHTAGALALDREFNILKLLSQDQEAVGKLLRVLDYFNIPKANGDMTVLLLSHPGENILAQYFPSSKLNAALFPARRVEQNDEEVWDEQAHTVSMELVTFLEFAVQATQCLEAVHSKGLIHREVRINAFHYSNAGRVRLVHFGNRSSSLESLGGPSGLVLQSDDRDWNRVKEAMSYMPPEQINNSATIVDREDHRTDLYALGVVLWILLSGQGILPFEGGVREFVSIVRQQRPLRIHEVRRDVPKVISDIIDKLLSKDPEDRYSSAIGLKHDFLQCQKWLNIASTTTQNLSAELIPNFELGRQDKYLEFTMPHALFGREKEVEVIHAVIHAAASGGGSYFSGSRHSLALSTAPSTLIVAMGQNAIEEEEAESRSHSGKSESTHSLPPGAGYRKPETKRPPTPQDHAAGGLPLSAEQATGRSFAVVVQGPGGMGKSSLVMEAMPFWRQEGGLWGSGKCSHADSTPYGPVFSCLSSVLQQLSSVYSDETYEFVEKLRQRLGANLPNVQLLFSTAPELKGILALHDITSFAEVHSGSTVELRARFIDLMVDVFAACSDIRHLALFFDDLHNANESTLEVVSALAAAKLRMIVFGTVRSESEVRLDRIRKVFTKITRTTWIELHPLTMDAMSAFVSQTLRVPPSTCTNLTKLVHRISRGSPFAARNLLTALRRQNYIYFDWEGNHWQYNIDLIQDKFFTEHFSQSDPGDVEFLVARMREFPDVMQRYVVWACFFGPAFKITDVAMMMDWEEANGNDDSDSDESKTSRGSMQGLQMALSEGWLVHRGRETCAFSHDRFRQAAVTFTEHMPPDVVMSMNLKIALVLVQQTNPDYFRVADFAKRSIPLLPEHPRRKAFLDVFLRVSSQATVQGAHEMALEYCQCARQLLSEEAWDTDNREASLSLLLKTAELLTWSGDNWFSDQVLDEILQHAYSPEDIGQVARLQARNCWKRNDFRGGLTKTIHGLRALGVDVEENVSEEETDAIFHRVQSQILDIGFENILALPHCSDSKVELTVSLLNDTSINAHWAQGHGLADVVGLKTIPFIYFRYGISTGTPGGFMWALGVAAERKGQFKFAQQMGKVAMQLAAQHSTVGDRAKYEVMYISLASGWNTEHLRANLARTESALRLSRAAGDRIYASLATLFNVQAQLSTCRHLSELVTSCEDAYQDVNAWISGNNTEILVMALLMCARALGGYTINTKAGDALDCEEFIESEYLQNIVMHSANVPFVLNWYNTYKVVALFSLGYWRHAAELGFQIYESRNWHPNYRHVRFGLTFHSLAMIQCLRDPRLSDSDRIRYSDQIECNQEYVRKWVHASPKNTKHWVTLVDAEFASLTQGSEALRIYDTAIKTASDNDWILEEGWALYLAGSHFIRCGMVSFGSEMQRRGIGRQGHWGALGIVNSMEKSSEKFDPIFKRATTMDVGVQTEQIDSPLRSVQLVPRSAPIPTGELAESDLMSLSADQFAQIIKWTQSISSEINLSVSLEKLTNDMASSSGSDKVVIVIRADHGDMAVSSSIYPPEPVQMHDEPIPLSDLKDPLSMQIMLQVIHSKEPVYQRDAAEDPRYSVAAQNSSDRTVLCFPIYHAGRGDMMGCIYMASSRPYAYPPSVVTMMTVLAQQASISITNCLLFQDVTRATRNNIRMINSQKEALEEARRSREDALKAAQTKSNFLASMSHELRTPFSSFYGLLDLLSNTDLDWEQRELVQTARQSCELLLEIIDGLLDYSKLEAAAVKLESISLNVEDLVGNAVELLTHLSVKRGLDLSFSVDPDVPFYILGDQSRLQQVLMNLLGNALKFTEKGSVKAICSVDKSGEIACDAGQVVLKWTVADTGIGMSQLDMKNLWQPFSQVDQSTTRKFGGTGLGLSICLSLVKLMHGDVGVSSELGIGSQFWFRIPATIHESAETAKEKTLMQAYRQNLINSNAMVLVSSPMETTRDLLRAALIGVKSTVLGSTEDAEDFVRNVGMKGGHLEFVVIDDQSEARIDDIAQLLQEFPSLSSSKIVHLCAPSADFLNRRPGIKAGVAVEAIIPELPTYIHGGLIARLPKPARTEKFLRLLSRMWDNRGGETNGISSGHGTPALLKGPAGLAAVPSAYAGNVLIAEDNPIAQKLLIRQLQRHGLTVSAANNGEEALQLWEKQSPGYFTAALFDHHMPVLDGVEATKRLRSLENKRKIRRPLTIFALSADCQDSTKLLCLSSGMTYFLTKPLRQSKP
ncbi:histidine kinase [Calocera viscosa TUFC12733]|uniref:histidine kinase n=1 Tax=Calocera viscosa (strain TUFC12733) TaxID=1330018 RepID=A0A167RB93_CALVF|nr:histidine kinase [Calocera viscosa TUFC12733]